MIVRQAKRNHHVTSSRTVNVNNSESNHTNPYSRFDKQQLILRDELALDRTVLANERTLLAYLRTVLALVLAGVTFLHFAKAIWFSIVGIVCLIVGLVLLPFAVHRFRRM